MRRYYRTRFILAAMLSFLIVLLLAAGGIWLFSYFRTENDITAFIKEMQSSTGEDAQPAARDSSPPMFGYTPGRRRYLSGFFDLSIDEEGTVTVVRQRGITEEAAASVDRYAAEAVAKRAADGKAGPYRYSVTYRDDKTARVILVDTSIQLRTLYTVLLSALTVGGVLLFVLFLILIPVSARVADAFAANAEKQKRFITDAGHDLKTPVAIIRSNLDVMDLTQGKSKWSGNIRSQTERLERLIEQLIAMARLDEHRETGPLGTVDLAALVREEILSFQAALDSAGAEVTDALPDRIPLPGDERALRQLIDLLLDNAARYIGGAGRLTIRFDTGKRKARLTMENTVDRLPGCPAEELTGRFVRGTTARTQKTGGAGIGLSAAQRIAEMHRGTLTVTYPREDLFAVTVELPIK